MYFEKKPYERVLPIDGRAVKKILRHSTRKNKSNDLEPQFQISATKSRCLEDPKTAVALRASKSRSQGGKIFASEARLELWRNYGTSYVTKMEVEVLPGLDLSQESAFLFMFLWAMQHRWLPFCEPKSRPKKLGFGIQKRTKKRPKKTPFGFRFTTIHVYKYMYR